LLANRLVIRKLGSKSKQRKSASFAAKSQLAVIYHRRDFVKKVELLKETVPNATQIAFFTRVGSGADQRFKEAEADAQRLGLRLQRLGAKSADDLERVFEAGKHAGVQAVLAHPSTFVVTNRARIIELAVKHRLPVIYSGAEIVEVASLARRVACGPAATITFTFSRTSSAAS
jgi:ABC-type uncharacterized transport system substrate-binding protein